MMAVRLTMGYADSTPHQRQFRSQSRRQPAMLDQGDRRDDLLHAISLGFRRESTAFWQIDQRAMEIRGGKRPRFRLYDGSRSCVTSVAGPNGGAQLYER
jgi:hypothetical protein